MAKLGISIPDELAQKLETLAKDKGKTVSAVVADALATYFSQNGNTSSSSKVSSPSTNPKVPSQEPPPVSNPSTPIELRLEYFIEQQKQLNKKYEDLDEAVRSDAAVIDEMLKESDEFDERLSKLWHDVHDK